MMAALSLDWIQTKGPTELTLFEVMQQGQQLDVIDTHTLALALQLKAHELMINERLSRQVAQDLELPVIGMFGVIVAAKHRALIPSVRRLGDTLVEQAGFRIGNRLYQKILRFAHEI